MEPESRPVKVVYDDGERIRALRGMLVGESDDKLFLILRRAGGDRAFIAKSAVRSIMEESGP